MMGMVNVFKPACKKHRAMGVVTYVHNHQDDCEACQLALQLHALREEKGKAYELLGPWGGAAAGLLGSIHNLIGEKEKVENHLAITAGENMTLRQSEARLREALQNIEANFSGVESNENDVAIRSLREIRKVTRAAPERRDE
jgi:arginine decarboxylase-like protein